MGSGMAGRRSFHGRIIQQTPPECQAFLFPDPEPVLLASLSDHSDTFVAANFSWLIRFQRRPADQKRGEHHLRLRRIVQAKRALANSRYRFAFEPQWKLPG